MAVAEQLWEGSEGSVFVFELGSCSVCVCVRAGMCQLWDCGCSCSPVWVPGAAWVCPSPAASLSRVCNHFSFCFCPAKERLFPGNGTSVWQLRQRSCCSALPRALQQLLRLQDPNPSLASGRRSCRVEPAVI